eukprot:1859031-Rhodomonas_salina.2
MHPDGAGARAGARARARGSGGERRRRRTRGGSAGERREGGGAGGGGLVCGAGGGEEGHCGLARDHRPAPEPVLVGEWSGGTDRGGSRGHGRDVAAAAHQRAVAGTMKAALRRCACDLPLVRDSKTGMTLRRACMHVGFEDSQVLEKELCLSESRVRDEPQSFKPREHLTLN